MSEKIWTDDPNEDIQKVYEWSQGDMETVRLVQDFHSQQDAQLILTNTDFHKAKQRVANIADRIRGKFVVEIGSGVGFAAIEMAKIAQRVIAIESDPGWNWVFCRHLYRLKPKNLIWIFGDARRCSFLYPRGEIIPVPQADVCVIFTRSGLEQMESIGSDMAKEVIMYHQEFPDGGEDEPPRI